MNELQALDCKNSKWLCQPSQTWHHHYSFANRDKRKGAFVSAWISIELAVDKAIYVNIGVKGRNMNRHAVHQFSFLKQNSEAMYDFVEDMMEEIENAKRYKQPWSGYDFRSYDVYQHETIRARV